MASEPKYFISSMVNVLKYSLDGVSLENSSETLSLDKTDAKNRHAGKMLEIDHDVEKKVKIIIDKLKTSHQKFEDVDFGPTEEVNSLLVISFFKFNFITYKLFLG